MLEWILKEISPEYSLEGLMLKLKCQYFGYLMLRADSFEKTLILGKIEGRRRGLQRKRRLDCITDSMDMSLSKLRELVMDRKAQPDSSWEVCKWRTGGFRNMRLQCFPWCPLWARIKSQTVLSFRVPCITRTTESKYTVKRSSVSDGWDWAELWNEFPLLWKFLIWKPEKSGDWEVY